MVQAIISLFSSPFFIRRRGSPGPPPCPLRGPSVITFLTATSPLPFLYSVCFHNMSSTTMGPKFIYIRTSHLESPSQVHVNSVQFIMWRGSTDPPCPPWGPSVSTCLCLVLLSHSGSPLVFIMCGAGPPDPPPTPPLGAGSQQLCSASY